MPSIVIKIAIDSIEEGHLSIGIPILELTIIYADHTIVQLGSVKISESFLRIH